jgi:hypothetical protein
MNATLTFSDGQTADSTTITRVTLLKDAERLLVETATGSIKIHGAGVHADAALLKGISQRDKRHFMVHEK